MSFIAHLTRQLLITHLLKMNGDKLRVLFADKLDNFVSPLGRQGLRIFEDGPDVGRDEKERG